MPLSKMYVITPWKIVWSPSFWLKQPNICICFLTLKTRSFINRKVMWSKHLLENVWLRPEAGYLTPRLILLMLPLWIVVQVKYFHFFFWSKIKFWEKLCNINCFNGFNLTLRFFFYFTDFVIFTEFFIFWTL